MNYISAEQFLEQPKKVQKVFLEWWKPSKGDIFAFLGDDTSRKIGVLGDGEDIKITTKGKGEYRLPLLTEGQLREFIEDKSSGIITVGYNELAKQYLIIIDSKGRPMYARAYLGSDLLQAHWKVALEIAKEIVK